MVAGVSVVAEAWATAVRSRHSCLGTRPQPPERTPQPLSAQGYPEATECGRCRSTLLHRYSRQQPCTRAPHMAGIRACGEVATAREAVRSRRSGPGTRPQPLERMPQPP